MTKPVYGSFRTASVVALLWLNLEGDCLLVSGGSNSKRPNHCPTCCGANNGVVKNSAKFLLPTGSTLGYDTPTAAFVPRNQQQLPPGLPRTHQLQHNRLAAQGTKNDIDNDTDTAATTTKSKKPRDTIVVTSELEVDIPIEIAYDAFADLPRQPLWSPWLVSVHYLDEQKMTSRWKMRYLGLSMSWNAISTNWQRPYRIQWESVSGMKNYGRVDFEPVSATNTKIRFTMTFEVPRLAATVMGKTGSLRKMVEDRMLKKTLENFRNVVVAENDLQR